MTTRVGSEPLEAAGANGLGPDPLFAALRRLDRLLEAACDAAEAAYTSHSDTDPYRSFYVSPQDFRQLLGRPAGAPMLYVEPDDAGTVLPLAEMQRAFGLSP